MSEKKSGTRPNIFRRRYWIDRSIQLPIIIYFLGLVGLTFAIFGAMFFVGFEDYITTFRNELPGVEYTAAQLQLLDARDLVISIFSYCLFFAFFAALLGGLFMSHRVAGPIYRLRLTLRQIAEDKKPKSVKFRKNDYTHGLAQDFNDAMKSLDR
jgi:hypothetical protein